MSTVISRAPGASIEQSIGASRCRLVSLVENVQVCDSQ